MRNVVITVGSLGIGLAIARRLAASGGTTWSRVARARDLGRALRETGADSLYFKAFDLGRTGEIPGFVKELRDAFGLIQVAVEDFDMEKGCGDWSSA